MERTEVHLLAFFVVDLVLRQQQGLVDIRAADELTQGLDVFHVEILVRQRQRHPDGPTHDLAERPQPEAFDPQPAPTPVLAVSDEVDVAIIA